MLEVLFGVAAVYAVTGVATAVTMLAWWAYERYAGAYRHKREELPRLWAMLLFCVLGWPLVVYALVAVSRIGDREFPPYR